MRNEGNQRMVSVEDDTTIELKLRKCTESEVLGALWVHMKPGGLYRDIIFDFQKFIKEVVNEQIRPIREAEILTEKELEELTKQLEVVSPITFTLFSHYLQAEQLAKMTDSEREKWLLEKLPDRFRARFKGNAACRSAREVTPEEEATKLSEQNSEDSAEEKGWSDLRQVIKDLTSDNPPEYIVKFLKGE